MTFHLCTWAVCAMTVQLHTHKVSSKSSFTWPRANKLLWFYAHSRTSVRNLPRMRYTVPFLNSKFTGQVFQKMSIHALGSRVKFWYGIKYRVLNTVSFVFCVSMFYWLKNFAYHYATTLVQIITCEITSDCTQWVAVQIEHLSQNREILVFSILSIENVSKTAVRRKTQDE